MYPRSLYFGPEELIYGLLYDQSTYYFVHGPLGLLRLGSDPLYL